MSLDDTENAEQQAAEGKRPFGSHKYGWEDI